MDYTIYDKLAALATKPILVICGEDDKIVNTKIIKQECSKHSNIQFVSIPKCGHAPQIEWADDVNKLIKEFCE